MDSFVFRKRTKLGHEGSIPESNPVATQLSLQPEDSEDDDTEMKLATLVSLHPHLDQDFLFEALVGAAGSVSVTCHTLATSTSPTKPKTQAARTIGHQTPISFYSSSSTASSSPLLTRKGQTLHLYTPDSIAQHTPCSIIHNFLPSSLATSLLTELLSESQSFSHASFKLFDNVVQSPHTACFYVPSPAELQAQKTDYLYNGSHLTDIRELTPQMRQVSSLVGDAVNEEVEQRIRTKYPEGKKLKYQSPGRWEPNAAFVNCYAGGNESVGYHTDQLTYLGPRAIIGSLSLGVAREFRVRKIVARDDEGDASGTKGDRKRKAGDADEQGQIAIHLPHNSLLVMHSEMQEEWKHSIAPAHAIDPHPVAGNRRINVTYRHYREEYHPKFTPRCKCGVATVLRCVQRKAENRGKYMWMCHTAYTPGKQGCSFFQWAEFDEDGRPPWAISTHDAEIGG